MKVCARSGSARAHGSFFEATSGGFCFARDPSFAETLDMRHEGEACGLLPPKEDFAYLLLLFC